jgi:hypothetical protein
MLADAAQAVGNKLYILGGGWSIIGPGPTPSAIALYIKIPWDQANVKHTMRLELVDSDGHPVLVDGADGEQPVLIENEVEVGRPPGLTPGTPIDVSLAINLGPLPLRPSGRYEWRLSIGEESDEDWRLPFSVRPAPPGWPGQAG